MKITLGIIAGITLSILWHTFGWRWLAWIMCQPACACHDGPLPVRQRKSHVGRRR